MNARRLLPLLLAAVAACASHQKLADRAAAVGDWKAAEREYAAALRDDPGSAELRARHDEARGQALSGAVARARACAGAEDWECAFAESDYAVGLDPGNDELARSRRDAARSVGLLRTRRAAEASARSEWAQGLQLVAAARAATDDPAVAAEARRLAPALVRGAVEEAERLRQAREYARAVELLSLASEADGAVRPRLEAVRAERERWLTAEYDRLSAEGDALLAARRYGEAQASYLAALRFRSGGRAAPLARYAGDLRDGEAAVAASQWDRATRAYESALRQGVDGGVAAEALERVRVRPWAVQLRAVMLRPAQPDGRPWVGHRNRVFDALMISERAAEQALQRGDPEALRLAGDVAQAVPAENQPTLVVVIDAAAGQRVATAPQRALYLAPQSAVVVSANRYDERPITVRVVQQDGPARELGAVSIPVGALLERRQVGLADGSILHVALEVAPADAPAHAPAGATAHAPAPAPPRR